MVTAARASSQILMHMGVAFGVMWAVTGSLAFGGVAAVVEPICNVALLPVHDRLWARMQTALEARKRKAAMAGAQLTG